MLNILEIIMPKTTKSHARKVLHKRLFIAANDLRKQMYDTDTAFPCEMHNTLNVVVQGYKKLSLRQRAQAAVWFGYGRWNRPFGTKTAPWVK